MAPFKPLPHMGKLFRIPPGELQSQYEKLKAFKDLVRQYDPNGKFRNDFLDHHLFK